MAAFMGKDVGKLKAKGGGKWKYMSVEIGTSNARRENLCREMVRNCNADSDDYLGQSKRCCNILRDFLRTGKVT